MRLCIYGPVVSAVDLAARAFPLVRPQPILVDELPLTQPILPTNAPLPQTGGEGQMWPVLLLPMTLLALVGLARVGRRNYRLPVIKKELSAD